MMSLLLSKKMKRISSANRMYAILMVISILNQREFSCALIFAPHCFSFSDLILSLTLGRNNSPCEYVTVQWIGLSHFNSSHIALNSSIYAREARFAPSNGYI